MLSVEVPEEFDGMGVAPLVAAEALDMAADAGGGVGDFGRGAEISTPATAYRGKIHLHA